MADTKINKTVPGFRECFDLIEIEYSYQFNIKESIGHEQSVFPQEIRAGFMKELVVEQASDHGAILI